MGTRKEEIVKEQLSNCLVRPDFTLRVMSCGCFANFVVDEFDQSVTDGQLKKKIKV